MICKQPIILTIMKTIILPSDFIIQPQPASHYVRSESVNFPASGYGKMFFQVHNEAKHLFLLVDNNKIFWFWSTPEYNVKGEFSNLESVLKVDKDKIFIEFAVHAQHGLKTVLSNKALVCIDFLCHCLKNGNPSLGFEYENQIQW